MKENEIAVWIDTEFRDVAQQMALDEALFLHASRSGIAAARFYTWERDVVSVGYFHDFSKTPVTTPSGSIARRITGGGVVEHGSDITFVLAFPKNSPFATLPGTDRYLEIHRALATALTDSGVAAELVGNTPLGNGPCFSTPVPHDIVSSVTGLKIAGGAQRKSRGDLIHQGSVRLELPHRNLSAPWVSKFLEKLSEKVLPLPERHRKTIESEALALQRTKYGTENWNRLPDKSRIN